MGLELGDVVVVQGVVGEGDYAGVITKLLPVVWYEGCELDGVEGDIEIQECGNATQNINGRIERKWLCGAQQVDAYRATRPNRGCKPVLLVIWAEALRAWGQPNQMLVHGVLGGRLTREALR